MSVFKTTYRVTWSDVDAAKVVHHANYFRLFQKAEEEFYEHLGFGTGFTYFVERGIWFPRTEAYCRFKAPSSLGDTLEISLTVKSIREKAVQYAFVIKKMDKDVTVAEGYVTAVVADRKALETVEIPSEIVQKLRAFKNG